MKLQAVVVSDLHLSRFISPVCKWQSRVSGNLASHFTSLIIYAAQLNGTKTLIAYFVRVLFHEICGEIPVLKRKFERYLTNRCFERRTCCVTIYSFPVDESLISVSAIKRHIFRDNELKLL